MLIERLVRAGLTSEVACDRIYNVYGQSATVTTIINRLRNDIRNRTLHIDLHLGEREV